MACLVEVFKPVRVCVNTARQVVQHKPGKVFGVPARATAIPGVRLISCSGASKTTNCHSGRLILVP